MRWFGLVALFFVVLFSFVSPVLAAGIPQMINYEGTLSNAVDGAPVSDGPNNLEFNLYDVPSAGTPLWTEKWDGTTSPAFTSKGVFNVMLGAHSPLPDDFFSKHPVIYLGIKVGDTAELMPRQRLGSVGFAFTAGNGIPSGGIIMWSGSVANIPQGWALCDGINGTPDLRARFIVGIGNVAGIGNYSAGNIGGEAAHVLTVTEMPSHTHIQNAHNHTQNPHRHTQAQTSFTNSGSDKAADNSTTDEWTTASATATNNPATAINQTTGGGAAHNNLPPYYALAFIMKL